MLRFLEKNIFVLLATLISILILMLIIDLSYLSTERLINLPIESQVYEDEKDMLEEVDLSDMKDISFEDIKRSTSMSNKAVTPSNSKPVNYNKLDQEVEDELKALENEVFESYESEWKNESTEDNPTISIEKNDDNNPKNENSNSSNEEEFSQYTGESYSESYVKDRNVIYERKPLYMCKGSAKVWVKVGVAQSGRIVEAKVDKEKTGMVASCFLEAAIKGAKSIRYNRDETAPKVQEGYVSYTFIKQ